MPETETQVQAESTGPQEGFLFVPYLPAGTHRHARKTQEFKVKTWVGKVTSYKKASEDVVTKDLSKKSSIKNKHQLRKSLARRQPTFLRCLAPKTELSIRERRGLEFFKHRTAIEWSGWHDLHFWTVVAMQVGMVSYPVRHCLIALGSFHEASTPKAQAQAAQLKALCVNQFKRAVTHLRQHFQQMNLLEILCAYIIMSETSACFNNFDFLQILRLQIDFRNQTRDLISVSDRMFVSTYFDPVIDRQLAKTGGYLDLIQCLQDCPASHFSQATATDIPYVFHSLQHARRNLENLLNWLAFQAKTHSNPSSWAVENVDARIECWLLALDEYQVTSDEEACSRSLLRVSAKLAAMMILMMNSEDEMFFDHFTDTYRELGQAFALLTSRGQRSSAVFGTGPGILSLMANTVIRWCRDPPLRSALIDLLLNAGRTEPEESAYDWAIICQHVQAIEQRDLVFPVTAQDIPKSNRIRVKAYEIRSTTLCQTLHYLKYPWRGEDVNSVQIPGHALPGEKTRAITCTLGGGFLSLLDDASRSEYRFEGSRFFFPLPRM